MSNEKQTSKNQQGHAPFSKRYKIQGTSFTTNCKRWFEFDEEEWQEFQKRRWTDYPAWSFDDNTITEV